MFSPHQRSRSSGHHQLTFEDLRGLRAEGYIRDSTLDQRDGFGPSPLHPAPGHHQLR